MISYIKGILTEIGVGYITVEAGGIGYRILVPMGAAWTYDRTGTEVKVWIHFAVTQDAFTLFGFGDAEEKEIFRLLITVSGIGPKGALGILGAMTADELRFAIAAEDDAAIARAPGIGKKTARKVILELKDKIDVSSVKGEDQAFPAQELLAEGSGPAEAVSALMALGYSRQEAGKAVGSVENAPELSVEEILRLALRAL